MAGFNYNLTTDTIETTSSLNFQTFGATGSLLGTSSWAVTASHIQITGSGITVNWSGSLLQLTASNATSASFASTASLTIRSQVIASSTQYQDVTYNMDDGLLYYALPPFVIPGTGYNNSIDAIAYDQTGLLLVGGRFTSYNGTGSGYFNTLNAAGRMVYSPFVYSTGFNAIFVTTVIPVLEDGRILLSSRDGTLFNGSSYTEPSLYFPNGTKDTTFNPGTGLTGPDTRLTSWAQLPSGDIIIVPTGLSTYNGTAVQRVIKLGLNGALDTTFNSAMNSLASGQGYMTNNTRVVTTPDDKIIAWDFNVGTSGGWTNSKKILKIDNAGIKDTTFETNIGTNIAGAAISNIMIEPGTTTTNYKLLVCANANVTSWNGTAITGNIFRLNADGTYDNTFTPIASNTLTANQQSATYGVYDATRGLYFVGGAFTTLNGSPQEYVGSFTNTGAINTTFARPAGGRFNAGVSALVKYPGGEYITCAGAFTTYGGAAAPRLARLDYFGAQA